MKMLSVLIQCNRLMLNSVCKRWTLLDFDSAEHARDGEEHLCNVGTYGYMAPEVECEDIRSTKSDIFSLGTSVMDMCSVYKGTVSIDIL